MSNSMTLTSSISIVCLMVTSWVYEIVYYTFGRFFKLSSNKNVLTEKIEKSEENMLRNVKTIFRKYYVELDNGVVIRTVHCKSTINSNPNAAPLLLVHGFATGLGFWCKNMDYFVNLGHDVYAIDLPGFGLSSRPTFPNDSGEIEHFFVDCFYEWIKSNNLHKIILVGHSFGGYLSALFAMKHGNCLERLVLVDIWGLPRDGRPRITGILGKLVNILRIEFFFRMIKTLSPLAIFRVVGEKKCMEIIANYRKDNIDRFNDEFPTDNPVVPYLYYLNCKRPTGELAFKSLSSIIGMAKNPLYDRFDQIDKSIPITFIYGSRSWISPELSYELCTKRTHEDANIDVFIIQKAGHHVHCDNSLEFNQVLGSIFINN